MFNLFTSDRWFKKPEKLEEDMVSTGAAESIALPDVVEAKEGSTHKVPLTTILEITPHGNAHSLEVARVYGFQVIVKKGQYKVGDRAVYVPIDSILPQWLEDKLFPWVENKETGQKEPPKIQLHHHRIRQIKIRGLASQGMLIDVSDLKENVMVSKLELEQDLVTTLGITKYEPPIAGFAQTQGKGRNRNKKTENPLFHKYNGLDNIKWFPTLFKEGEDVVVQEKLHGTNARASILPYSTTTLWKRIKKFLGLAPEFEKCYGSNNVEISATTSYKGFYGEDIYGKCFSAMDVFSKLRPGEIVYGEIVGPSIQKNYTYGLQEHRFVVFDMKTLQPDGKFEWQTPETVEAFCKERGFEHVPILYRGKYDRDAIYALTKGPSAFGSDQKVREGVVVKAANYYDTGGNKKALKWVSEDYLDDKSNTDFH